MALVGGYGLRRVSDIYAEVLNIIHAAVDHRQHCNESCNVSLRLLRAAASRLVALAPLAERAELTTRIEQEIEKETWL